MSYVANQYIPAVSRDLTGIDPKSNAELIGYSEQSFPGTLHT